MRDAAAVSQGVGERLTEEQLRTHYRQLPAVIVVPALGGVGICSLLDRDRSIETTLLIYLQGFEVFEDYLDFTTLVEALLVEQGYEGI